MAIIEAMQPTQPNERQLLASPCTSYWLKDAIRALNNRDSLDSLRDVELLLVLAQRRANQ